MNELHILLGISFCLQLCLDGALNEEQVVTCSYYPIISNFIIALQFPAFLCSSVNFLLIFKSVELGLPFYPAF